MSTRRISEPKGFQRVTAEAALVALTCKDGPRRFLVADEVGLGKTVVARTIINEMMKRRRRPLIVFYVSSNLNIAHAKSRQATSNCLRPKGNKRPRPRWQTVLRSPQIL